MSSDSKASVEVAAASGAATVATAGPWNECGTNVVGHCVLGKGTLAAVKAMGMTSMTPVQAQAIPLFLNNKDVVVQAATGSGKTLSYLLPVFELLQKPRDIPYADTDIGAMVIVPTRELALQVTEVANSIAPYVPRGEEATGDVVDIKKRLQVVKLVGGMTIEKDLESIRKKGCNIVIGTPGRLLKVLVDGKKLVNVKTLEMLVLDEADRLLDMGFRLKLSQIIDLLPRQRRTGLFSATQTNEVDDLSRAGTRNPTFITIENKATRVVDGAAAGTEGTDSTGERAVPTTLTNLVMECPLDQKLNQLVHFLRQHPNSKMIVYFMTCSCVQYFSAIIAECLKNEPDRLVVPLHGKLAPKQRLANYSAFVKAPCAVMLCTDVAARGLDIPNVNWIVQYDAPQDPNVFVHRIGRTGRMGALGNTLLMLTPQEMTYVEFLHLRKIDLDRIEPATEGVEDVIPIAKELAKTDRDVFSPSQDAFVTYMRGYKEHQCSFIFRMEKLDVAALARGMGLLRLPRLSETRKMKVDYADDPTVDFDMIPFKDPKREERRLAGLEELRRKREKAEAKKRAAKELTLRDKKKMKKMVKVGDSSKSEKWSTDELDELVADAMAIKKTRKHKMSEKQLDEQLEKGLTKSRRL